MGKPPTAAAIRRKAIAAIAEIPPDALAEVCYTPDLLGEFEGCKKIYYLIAMDWKAKLSGGDPLGDLREQGTFNQLEYEYLQRLADDRWEWWQVVRLSFRFVKKEFNALKRKKRAHRSEKFPFDSDIQLFAATINESLEAALTSKMGYWDGSMRTRARYNDLLLRLSSAPLDGRLMKQFESISRRYYPVPPKAHPITGCSWAKFVMRVAAKTAEKNKIIADAVDRCNAAGIRLAETEKEIGTKNWYRAQYWEGGEIARNTDTEHVSGYG